MTLHTGFRKPVSDPFHIMLSPFLSHIYLGGRMAESSKCLSDIHIPELKLSFKKGSTRFFFFFAYADSVVILFRLVVELKL